MFFSKVAVAQRLFFGSRRGKIATLPVESPMGKGKIATLPVEFVARSRLV
jgi:hypothetical protein